MKGYNALREDAAWIDLPGRGHILAHGDDRKRLLHAMTTNHVEQLQPGQGCYAFFLNDRGRIISDVNILCRPEYLILDVEPEVRQLVYEHLDKYIIADDVTLEDRSEQTAAIAVEGPRAAEVLGKIGVAAPGAPNAQVGFEDALVVSLSVTGAPGFRLFVPAESKQSWTKRLESAGAVEADADAVQTVRLEHGRPRYGSEVTERYLAQETQLDRALHFSKGCYLGQEIVERVRSRGQVHRRLMRIEIGSSEPAPSGTKLSADGNPTAEVVSSVFSPGLGKVVGLAYVRTELARPGEKLEGAAGPAAVVGPPA
jgi:folate-binding protein YgfZ